ncbi:phosphoenolpyruvate hydrolase family protein [Pleomorphomonas oryzae]|uniref:phosphoenolpyruvate hydrolase family protein n=1 Tax=Pleomorphomonas oryzae TaxID=261934 RepID=UPI0003F74EE3|nr:phosphoenolpyruvate hydrolase family protein [Pleomorphomonas oryzae]
MLKSGEIVDRVTRRSGGFQIVCPHFAGLGVDEADMVGCLPIGDANGAMLAAAGTLGDDDKIFAGILAADPFRPAPMLVGLLQDAGVRAVVNLPTVARITDGLAEALSHAGVDYASELATLARAAELGLNVLAVVATGAQARQAIAAGLRQLLVYPAPVEADPASRNHAATIALDTAQAIREAAPDATVLAFRHPSYGPLLAPLIAASDGVVEWAVSGREKSAG